MGSDTGVTRGGAIPFPGAALVPHGRTRGARADTWTGRTGGHVAHGRTRGAPAEELSEALDERVLRAATAAAAERLIVVPAEVHADHVGLPRGRAVAARAHLRRAAR